MRHYRLSNALPSSIVEIGRVRSRANWLFQSQLPVHVIVGYDTIQCTHMHIITN
jgi:hypothetical protein